MHEEHIVKCAKSAFYWSGESINSGESDVACKFSVSGDFSQTGESCDSGDYGHTWYLSFFYTDKIFGEKNLHRRMRKLWQTDFATK